MGLNSCLYECSVMHHRLAPKEHHFQHDIFMFYLDLDELEELGNKILLFSHNRRNVYNFCDADHEPSGSGPLKQRLLKFLRDNGISFPADGRIMLLTLPRAFGYIFNPVSIYYCFDAAGRPVCAIGEVGNTFREMKLYLLGAETLREKNIFCQTVVKHFYVSPFSDLKLEFDFRLRIPAETLEVKIDDRDGADKILISTLTGRKKTLTNAHLMWLTAKFPFVTLKVIFLIHWHAFRLWLKRVPFYAKAANPALQRDVLRPHATLVLPSK